MKKSNFRVVLASNSADICIKKNMTNFRIEALDQNEFSHLFELNDRELAKQGIKRMIVDAYPGYPCRVSLGDIRIGEEVILLPFEHHKTDGPYQGSGPIFIGKKSKKIQLSTNEIPPILRHRLLSIRAYDQHGLMQHAIVGEGSMLLSNLQSLFQDSAIDYIHIHNAKQGCYNCRVERV